MRRLRHCWLTSGESCLCLLAATLLHLALAGDRERKIWYDAAAEAIETRVRGAAATASRSGQTARGVVLFIGDGMGMSTLTAARILYGQRHGNTGEEAQLAWDRFPAVALARTYNMDAQIGESSACATALLRGVKANYETVGLDSSGQFENCRKSAEARAPSLIDWAHERGKSTGLVTTTRVTHATPAALYANSPSRYWEDDSKVPPGARSFCKDIALQLLENEPGRRMNVILGGGRRSFVPRVTIDPEEPGREGRRLDGRNLIEEWTRQRRGLAAKYVTNKEQLERIDPRTTDHLLGLFAYSHMDFDVDRNKSANGDPSLAEMTMKALRIVSKNPNGYFLLVEGGRIDHAHHRNNAYRALDETLAMEEAVRTVMREVDISETLIVVTADHSHVLALGGLAARRGNPIFGSDGEPSDVDGKPYTTLLYSNGPGHAEPRSVVRGDVADSRDSMQTAGVPRAWATHGGEDVPVFAIGPLSTVLFSGSIDQSYVPHAISYAACLESRHVARCAIGDSHPREHAQESTTPDFLSVIGSSECPSVGPNSAAISVSGRSGGDDGTSATVARSSSFRSPTPLSHRSYRFIEESDALAREISAFLVSSNLGNSEILRSWKYPSTPSIRFNAIDALKRQRGTAGEMYILLLELAYDRIHSVLGLMMEFVKHKSTVRSSRRSRDESTFADDREGWNEGTATVASAATLLWWELRRRAESRLVVRYRRHLASLDESRRALASRLATMTEAKIALEKIISEERSSYPFRETHIEVVKAAAVENRNGASEVRRKEIRTGNESSAALLTPEDDPLADMTKELVSNKKKIDVLIHQNERISRLIARITEFRRDLPRTDQP